MSCMSISRKTILGLFLCSVLAGCIPPPAPEELARGDYGPWPHAYQDVIKHHMQDALKDPTSAHYDFVRGPMRTWNTYAGALHFGYAVCAMINVKDSHGSYLGAHEHYFLLHQHAVVQELGGRGGVDQTRATSACAEIPMRYT